MVKDKIFSKPIVMVKWCDACTWDSEYPPGCDFPMQPVESYGRLLSMTKKKVVLARDIFYQIDFGGHDESQASGIIVIPRQWVMKIKILKSFKSKRKNIV